MLQNAYDKTKILITYYYANNLHNINTMLKCKSFAFMIIGTLGKGGSGKSTIATQLTLGLAARNNRVLGIDADHNQDLTYNLLDTDKHPTPFGGSALADIKAVLNLKPEEHYSAAFSDHSAREVFRLSPIDEITSKYAHKINDEISLMSAGRETDQILFGQACSHSLTTPLKAYLPLLKLNQNEYVVVDEKAGADGASTGIVTGFDMALVMVEPTRHSTKAAGQIIDLLNFFATPYLIVANKISQPEDLAYIESEIGKVPDLKITNQPDLGRDSNQLHDVGLALTEQLLEIIKTSTVTESRLERSLNKFKRNLEFASSHA